MDDIRNKTEQTKCSLSIDAAYGSLMDSISKIKTMGLSDPIVKPEVALMVTKSLLLIIQAVIYDETQRHVYTCIAMPIFTADFPSL